MEALTPITKDAGWLDNFDDNDFGSDLHDKLRQMQKEEEVDHAKEDIFPTVHETKTFHSFCFVGSTNETK